MEFTTRSYGKSFIEIKQIFEKWKPDLVHTHYEAYDIVVAKVVKKLNWDIRMVWHIHDYMTLDTSGESLPLLRKLKRHFSLFFTLWLLWETCFFDCC
ncbi:glycosyltransferase [Bacteroides fragilis]